MLGRSDVCLVLQKRSLSLLLSHARLDVPFSPAHLVLLHRLNASHDTTRYDLVEDTHSWSTLGLRYESKRIASQRI